jgi:signal transduction histidine kinase
MKPKDEWIYWVCQIAGWGGYSAIAFAFTTAFTGWRPVIFAGYILFLCYSVGLTHLLRLVIKKRQWLTLPASQGLPRVFGGAVCTGILEALLVLVISRILQGENTFDRTATISMASGVVFITCAWAAIYVGAQWYRRYRQAQLRDMQTQLSLRDAELRALQAQVNPHFLFNSLNTIRGTVRENPEQAEHMITNLASLFRRSLRPDNARMIPLSEEMAAVSDYLDLESARFEERLQVRLEVSAEAGPCPVPAMLVQTLVENAINHGIARLPRGGIVSIRGDVRKKALILEVENTGKLQEPSENGTHTGLANSRERLRLLCGSDATLSLSENEGVVRVTVTIPQIP